MRSRRAASRGRHAISSRSVAATVAITGSDSATTADPLALKFPGDRGRAEKQLGQPCGIRWSGVGNGRGRPRSVAHAHPDVMDERVASAALLLECRLRRALPGTRRYDPHRDTYRARLQ